MSEMYFDTSGILLFSEAAIAWEIRMLSSEQKEKKLTPADFASPVRQECENKVKLIWCGHNLKIETVWQQDYDGRISGKISVCGEAPSEDEITAVAFPAAKIPLNRSTRLFLPVNEGVETGSVLNMAVGVIESRPFKTMQFVACYDDKGGIYFDHRDSKWNNKSFEFVRSAEVDLVEYYSLHSAVRYTLKELFKFKTTFENSVVSFKGNWFESCQIYRRWGIKQKWATAERDNSRIRDIALWFWNRGAIDHVIPPVEKLQQDAGVPVALDWYWWHHNPYDTDYPNYWPPREGVENFTKAVKRLNGNGIFTQVYMNGMCWDMDNPTFKEGGEESTVILRDGSFRFGEFNCFNHHRLAFICADGKPFFDRLSHQVDCLQKTGLPGVYLDMIGCASYEDCFNPDHNHAPGGGCYQVEGYRRYLTELRKKYPDLKLCTEECNEAYMDLFDSVIVLDSSAERVNCTPQWDYVPAFSAVYHGVLPVFGSYALPDGIPPFDSLWPADGKLEKEKNWLELYPLQFQIEFARGLIWGQQPTVANLTMEHITDSRFAEIYRFICNGAQFYYTNREFLFDGRMLSPGQLECSSCTVDFVQRMIFTKEDQLKDVTKNLPALLHSCWESHDGRRVLIVCNYTKEPQPAHFEGHGMKIELTVAPESFQLVKLKSLEEESHSPVFQEKELTAI